MEELIYLAVVVGWFLLNAYKKSQAKKQQEAERPQRRNAEEEYAPDEASTVEDLLRQLMGEETRPPEPVKVAPAPPPRDEPKPFLTYDAPKAERPASLKQERAAKKAQNSSAGSRTTFAEPQESFDLREAIIHQAILQRPYA